MTSTVLRLAGLLRMRVVPGHAGAVSFIGSEISLAMSDHNRGRLLFRDLQLMKLQFFAEHLRQIEAYDPKLLSAFRREFRRRLARDQYVGLRFEVATAARLIRRGVPFTRGERPDFYLTFNGARLGIECTTATITDPARQDPLRKISEVVWNKRDKPYATPSTAIFVDISDVIQRASLVGASVGQEPLEAALRDGLSGSAFGAAIGFFYAATFHADRSRHRIFVQPVVAISESCDRNLAAYVKTLFPLSQADDSPQWHPRSG